MNETPDDGSEKLITVPAVIGLTLIILSVPAYFVLKRIGSRWQTPPARVVVQPAPQQAAPVPAAAVVPEPIRPSRRSDPPPAKSAASASPVTEAPPARVWPNLPPATFDRVRVLIDHGDVFKEREAILTLHGDRLSVLDRKEKSEVVTLPYEAIVQAFFSRTKQPRWGRSGATEEIARVDRGKMSMFRGERNWLILTTQSRPVFIALDDSSVSTALSLVEQRTGVTIVK
jgi:hypothetical protein